MHLVDLEPTPINMKSSILHIPINLLFIQLVTKYFQQPIAKMVHICIQLLKIMLMRELFKSPIRKTFVERNCKGFQKFFYLLLREDDLLNRVNFTPVG